MHDFLDLILHSMLVVEDKPLRDSWKDVDMTNEKTGPRQSTIGSASGVSLSRRQERLSCGEVVNQLNTMIRKGTDDDGYYSVARRWTSIPKRELQSQEVTVKKPLDVLRQKQSSLVRPLRG